MTVKCVLWESYADKLLEVLPESGIAEAGIVIILQFALKFPFQSNLIFIQLFILMDSQMFGLFRLFKFLTTICNLCVVC